MEIEGEPYVKPYLCSLFHFLSVCNVWYKLKIYLFLIPDRQEHLPPVPSRCLLRRQLDLRHHEPRHLRHHTREVNNTLIHLWENHPNEENRVKLILIVDTARPFSTCSPDSWAPAGSPAATVWGEGRVRRTSGWGGGHTSDRRYQRTRQVGLLSWNKRYLISKRAREHIFSGPISQICVFTAQCVRKVLLILLELQWCRNIFWAFYSM